MSRRKEKLAYAKFSMVLDGAGVQVPVKSREEIKLEGTVCHD